MWMLDASAVGCTDLKGGAGPEGCLTDLGYCSFQRGVMRNLLLIWAAILPLHFRTASLF